jgi:LmbE family N-acetylglucosaminyl deacetylase
MKKFIKNWRKFKVYLIIAAAAILVIFGGVFFYFRQYQDLPEFGMSLMKDMDAPKAGQKILIFSPHPDDETLGAGGYIAEAIKNGAEVKVVFITNGDGHWSSSVEEFKEVYLNASNYIQSGKNRQQESQKALAVLGVKKENIIFLGYPDMGLKYLLGKNFQNPHTSPFTKKNASPYADSYRQNASYTGENLLTDMTGIISDFKPDVVLVTSPSDIHPDHAAAAAFTQKALNKNPNLHPKLYYFLIHYKRFPYPKGFHPTRMITPPSRLIQITNSWYKFILPGDILNLKEEALKQYPSQLKVPMLKNLMQGFLRQNELFQEGNS